MKRLLFTPPVVYEMYDDKTLAFKSMVKRMQRLGYSVKPILIEREYQASQQIGNNPKTK